MHKFLLMTLVALAVSACNQIPGNIDKTQPASADPAPPRLDPVIHCAPDTTAVAMAGIKTPDMVASCAPPSGIQRS